VTIVDELPRGWTWAPLADLTVESPHSITDGPFGSHLKTSHYTTAGPRVVRLQNIGDGNFIDERAHISEEHFGALCRHEVAAGDLLIALLGDTLPRACVAPPSLGPAIVKADCVRARLDARLTLPAYVSFALNSGEIRKYVTSIRHGVGRPRINLRELKEIPIPLAPRPEQDRIVAEIDQQLSRIEAGVAGLRRVEGQLARYRASVLKAACEGRLVPTEAELARAEGRRFESGDSLLERIREKGRVGIESSLARGDQPRREIAEASPTVPEGWCWTTLGELSLRITKGTTPTSVGFSFTPTGIRFVKVESLVAGRIDHSQCAFIAPVADAALARSRLMSGDLLFSIAGTLGRLAVVRAEDLPANTNQAIAIIRLLDQAVGPFLLVALSSARTQERVAAEKRGVGLFNLNLRQVGSWEVPLPPLAEQCRIVAEVERRLSIADEIAATIDTALARAERLRQSILKRAFEGKLVPQDPNDEPASVLLERIRKEREAAAEAKQREPKPRRARGTHRRRVARS